MYCSASSWYTILWYNSSDVHGEHTTVTIFQTFIRIATVLSRRLRPASNVWSVRWPSIFCTASLWDVCSGSGLDCFVDQSVLCRLSGCTHFLSVPVLLFYTSIYSIPNIEHFFSALKKTGISLCGVWLVIHQIVVMEFSWSTSVPCLVTMMIESFTLNLK